MHPLHTINSFLIAAKCKENIASPATTNNSPRAIEIRPSFIDNLAPNASYSLQSQWYASNILII